jgi:hypothetical protein
MPNGDHRMLELFHRHKAIKWCGENIVRSVDSLSADLNGNVSFTIGNDKWVKTNSSGHLVAATSEPVDLDSEQTITAKKIWDKGGRFNSDVEIYNSTLKVTNPTKSGTGTIISHGKIILDDIAASINIRSNIQGDALLSVHTGDKRLEIYKEEGIELRGTANGVVLYN